LGVPSFGHCPPKIESIFKHFFNIVGVSFERWSLWCKNYDSSYYRD